jgi:hypothetical protein
MVRRHLSGDFNFVCLTDDASGIRPEVQCLPIPPLNLQLKPGQRDGALHPSIGADGTLRVIGVNHLDRAQTADAAHVRMAVQPPAFQPGDVMAQQPHAMAVHAQRGGMHHRAGRGIGRAGIGTAGGKNGAAKVIQRRQ